MDDIFDDMFEPEQALGEIHTDNTKQLSQLVCKFTGVYNPPKVSSCL